MTKAAYWKGERLYDDLRTWDISPDAQLGKLTGVFRLMGKLNARHRNFFQELSVDCSVRPVTAHDDLDEQTTYNAALHQKHDALLDLADPTNVTDPLGPVSWCSDDTQTANVTTGGFTGDNAVVTHDTPGGSWTTEVGHYVLVRNPTNGDGFVAIIEARTASSVTIDIPSGTTVSTDYDLVNIQMHYPNMAYLGFSKPSGDIPSGDRHATGGGIIYRFVGGADSRLVLATDYQQTLT